MYSIQIDLALPKIKAASRAHVFEQYAAAVSARISYPKALLLERLMLQESCSASDVGDGVAIPHLKLPGVQKRLITMITLEKPLSSEAFDDKPVDLICILLSPESDGPVHLRGLSRISRILKSKDLCQKLRDTKDADAMRAIFNNPEGWVLAA